MDLWNSTLGLQLLWFLWYRHISAYSINSFISALFLLIKIWTHKLTFGVSFTHISFGKIAISIDYGYVCGPAIYFHHAHCLTLCRCQWGTQTDRIQQQLEWTVPALSERHLRSSITTITSTTVFINCVFWRRVPFSCDYALGERTHLLVSHMQCKK